MIMKYSELISEVRRLEDLQTHEYSITIYFLRNFTIEMIEPYIKYHLIHNKIKPEVIFWRVRCY